jgi:hypothetical protein
VQVDHQDASSTILASEKHLFWGYPTFIGHTGTDYPVWKDGREFQTEALDANGGTLTRAVNTWKQRASVGWWLLDQELAPPNDPRMVDTVTTLADVNKVSRRTAIHPDDANIIGFDQYNNPTDVWEYDFGGGSPGPLIRHTQTAYVTTNNGVNYATDTSIHLRSLPARQSIYDASGTERARTSYEYDNHTADANHAPLVSRPNITQLHGVFTSSYTRRGNATGITRYLLSDGAVTGSVSTYQQYDVAGNVVKAKDARGYLTDLDFSDRFGIPDEEARNNVQAPPELGSLVTYAFVTKVTNALSHTTYSQYDYYLGRPVNGEDANGVVAKGRYDDALGRPTELVVGITPGGQLQRRTTFAYDDVGKAITTRSDQAIFQDGILTSTLLYDGLGRTTQTRAYEGATYITTKQEYDGLGRVRRSYNPYRTTSDETYGWTDTTYDGLGRVIQVATFDRLGASTGVVVTTYSGNTTTVRDQAGKQRRSVTDGLGRLKTVDEMNEYPNTTVYATTSYDYDALDNLVHVAQGSQHRYFMYDSLSRLIRASNPEQDANANIALDDPITGNSSWCYAYSYDPNSNLETKTDARNVTTTHTYDALNRVRTRSYSGPAPGGSTPAVSTGMKK